MNARTVTGRFANKNAVVTGAASGIGRAIACRILAEGGTVTAGDVNGDGLDALARELGEAAITVRSDVTIETDVEILVGACVEHFGSVDLMFNVAGASRRALIVDMTEEDWDFTVNLCLKGVLFGIKHAARQMIPSGGGAIVNVASLNSRIPMILGAAYSAAKAGVVSLTQTAAIELAEHGIRVNAISPGVTATPLIGDVLDRPEAVALLERIPLGRAAGSDEIASAAVFLASSDASYITGANLFADGGWEHAAYPDVRRIFASSTRGS
jgi:NAD(P)-dependent dehydrogenase (short-subunit alcohol dehydrogenase family)